MTNTWDAANRLVETSRDDYTLQPIYNGVGDRVAQTVGATTTHFALDVGIGLPEVIASRSVTTTSEGNTYLHLPGVIMAENATGETRYLLSDGLGSIRHVVDETGEVVDYNEFDPYGNPVTEYGIRTTQYGFTGEWWEDDLGLLYFRARWYLPQDGVFLSRDLVESEPAYQYVGGNPVNRMDPSGLFSEQAIIFSVSPEVRSILESRRKGLYKLLREAKEKEIVDPLWTTITPYIENYSPVHPVPLASAILTCKGPRIEAQILSVNRYLPLRPMSLDDYIKDLDYVEVADITSVYQRGGNSYLLKTQYAVPSFTHYYSLSEPNSQSRFSNARYYSDFAGQDSPLPDVVGKEFSIDLWIAEGGRMKLIDKFGNGYISWGVNIGPGSPINVKIVDGYVYPPAQANDPISLQRVILGPGYSIERDFASWGGGVGFPIPEAGRSITWYSRGFTAGLGYTATDTSGPYNWGIQGWDFLDEDVPAGIVASVPDNGCNCGQ